MNKQQLQTNPYISLVHPNEPIPLIYMTDSRAPSYADAGNPPLGTHFGAVGLDRRVVWSRNPSTLMLLEAAAASPVSNEELTVRYGALAVAEAVSQGWAQPPDELCVEYKLYTAQIEVTAHCNWRCRFCPVSTEPKANATMPMVLFADILEKLSVVGTIKFVTFHFFNEPTLDRFFAERVRLLAHYRLRLALYSNVGALDETKIELLRRTGVLHHLIVNLPSLDKEAFQSFTGSSTYRQTLRNLDAAIEAGFPVTLSVNGSSEELGRSIPALQQRYGHRGVEVREAGTCDRSGEIVGLYAQNVRVTGRLRGCSWPLHHAYFAINGNLFLCCNDYHQSEVYGNIRDGSIHELMTSRSAVAMRRRVFGVHEAPTGFICRSCHDQELEYPFRQFRPPASFPLDQKNGTGSIE